MKSNPQEISTRGVSFASVNYPFVQQVDGNYAKILEHCTESIQFLKKNAKKFNIDINRISVMGNSAVLLSPAIWAMPRN